MQYKLATIDRRQEPWQRRQAMKDPGHLRQVGDSQVRQLVFSLDKVIPSGLSILDEAVAEITAAIAHSTHWDDTDGIDLAMREAVANAIVHGNHCQPGKSVRVSVAVYNSADLVIVVKDSGSGFDPSKLPNVTAAENLLADHGRGIFLMRQFMDQVDFKFDHGTEVRMHRRPKVEREGG